MIRKANIINLSLNYDKLPVNYNLSVNYDKLPKLIKMNFKGMIIVFRSYVFIKLHVVLKLKYLKKKARDVTNESLKHAL